MTTQQIGIPDQRALRTEGPLHAPAIAAQARHKPYILAAEQEGWVRPESQSTHETQERRPDLRRPIVPDRIAEATRHLQHDELICVYERQPLVPRAGS